MPSMETSTTSGLRTADAAITTRPAKLQTIMLIDGGAGATLTVYDNASAASGNVLFKGFVGAGSSSETFHLTTAVEANKGLFADVAGAGAAYIIHYSLL